MKNTKLIFLAILTFSIFFSSCYRNIITGQGDIIEQTLELPEFTQIVNSAPIDVNISYGDSLKVVAIGHSNIIDRLRKTVSFNKWNIELLPGNYRNFSLTLYITTPDFELIKVNGSGNFIIDNFDNLKNVKLNINGSGNLVITDTIQADYLDLNINGSGYIELVTLTKFIDSKINGSGNILLSGKTNDQKLIINGSGQYEAFDLESENTDIEVHGSGDSQVKVSDFLKIRILGSGDVYYKGYPNTDISISGSGSVNSWN